ncbi:hypothetical protein CsSME_00018731 [Camellia sinensis var. sinensis]
MVCCEGHLVVGLDLLEFKELFRTANPTRRVVAAIIPRKVQFGESWHNRAVFGGPVLTKRMASGSFTLIIFSKGRKLMTAFLGGREVADFRLKVINPIVGHTWL